MSDHVKLVSISGRDVRVEIDSEGVAFLDNYGEGPIIPASEIPALRAFLDQHFPQEEKK